MSNYEDLGYVLVEWDDTLIDVDFYSWRVYRRLVGATSWTLLYETTDTAGPYEYKDWLPLSGESYEYTVVQVVVRFGVQIESDYVPSSVVVPESSHYWLIHPTDSTLNLRLHHVTADDFTEDVEQEDMVIIERGRRTDYGTEMGFAGSLTADLRDWEAPGPAVTGREQRELLRALKARLDWVYLRNPFGDLVTVTMANISFSRTAGVGRREFLTVTIPYAEVV